MKEQQNAFISRKEKFKNNVDPGQRYNSKITAISESLTECNYFIQLKYPHLLGIWFNSQLNWFQITTHPMHYSAYTPPILFLKN